MQRTLLALLTVTLGAGAAAQNSFVVPSAAATSRPSLGSPWMSAVFFARASSTIPSDSRSQSIYDSTDVGPAAASLSAIQFRRPSGLPNANPAMTTNLKIDISTSPNPFTAVSATFDRNHGANRTAVFAGRISLPQATDPGSWPAPWQAPIPFATPFPFVKNPGESLVVDFLQTGNTGGASWWLEYTDRDGGERGENGFAQSSCVFSNGRFNSSLTYGRLAVGGSWFVAYSNLLPNVAGIASLGIQGVGSTWNGALLPLDLGVVGAPGCTWNIAPLASVRLVADSTGFASWPSLPIPNDPALGGASFYDHAAWFDAAANPAGVVTGWSSRWTIGTNRGGPGAFVSATGTRAGDPIGTVLMEEMPTFQFRY